MMQYEATCLVLEDHRQAKYEETCTSKKMHNFIFYSFAEANFGMLGLMTVF